METISPYVFVIIFIVCIVLFTAVFIVQKIRGHKVISFNYLEEVEEKLNKNSENDKPDNK